MRERETNRRDCFTEVVLLEVEIVAAEFLSATEKLSGAGECLERFEALCLAIPQTRLPRTLLILLFLFLLLFGEPLGIDLARSTVLAAQERVKDIGRLAQQHHLVEHGSELLGAGLDVCVAAALDLGDLCVCQPQIQS